MLNSLRLGGADGWQKQCGRLLEYLPSPQTHGKDTMPLFER